MPEPRTIQFSGHTWQVKEAATPVGPGPNNFSADPADVWVDAQGALHMTIRQRGGQWYCSEVVCTDTLQYGTYTFTVSSPLGGLDANVVLGLFTWDDDAPQHNFREIDIEIARWGDPHAANAQYVIQPYDSPGKLHRFFFTPATGDAVHAFTWQPREVRFTSRGADGAAEDWTFTNAAAIPPHGGGNARINLWLMNGLAPTNAQEVEVVMKSFTFQPFFEKKVFLGPVVKQ